MLKLDPGTVVVSRHVMGFGPGIGVISGNVRVFGTGD